MFEKFVEQVKKNDRKEEYVNVDFSKMSALNVDYCREQIAYNISNLSDNELYKFISANYKTILQDIIEKEDSRYLSVVSNSRFITIFTEVIRTVNLTFIERKYCNKIAYSYLTHGLSDKTDYMRQLYFNMSKVVNYNLVMSLLGLGLQEEFCCFLALSRYSHDNELINTKRVNNIIISNSIKTMDEQMIIKIFEKLYDEFYILFNGVMYDVYPDIELENISEDASEIYSNMSLAVVDMLNTLPSQVMYSVLLKYIQLYKIDKDHENIRFKLYSLAASDYTRILEVLKSVIVDNGILDTDI